MSRLREYTPKILVIGDLMLDHYLWGTCKRISPEAPVQVVDIDRETTVLGGAGNVANNLIAMGAKVTGGPRFCTISKGGTQILPLLNLIFHFITNWN